MFRGGNQRLATFFLSLKATIACRPTKKRCMSNEKEREGKVGVEDTYLIHIYDMKPLSFRLFFRMTSLHMLNTVLTFDVSVAQVRWW